MPEEELKQELPSEEIQEKTWNPELGKEEEVAVPTPELTYGEKLVGLTFNPGGDPNVYACKKDFASIIDNLARLREQSTSPEQKRHLSVAITQIQDAQMRSVKALTRKD